QWPDNRLLVPVEGTGYLDLLESWRTNTTKLPAEGPATRDPNSPVPEGLFGGAAEPLIPPPPPNTNERPFSNPPLPSTTPGATPRPGTPMPPTPMPPDDTGNPPADNARPPGATAPPGGTGAPGATPTPMSLRRANPGTNRVVMSPTRSADTP